MRAVERLWPSVAALAVALALPACKPTVIGCQQDDADGAILPDGSFEEEPTQWTLASHSTIDDQRGVCDGGRSLHVVLDHGIGTGEVTSSAAFTGLEPNREYELGFHYRYENCKEATLYLEVGSHHEEITFEGTDGTWGESSFVFQVGTDPARLDIRPGRNGAAEDFATSDYDDNRMWVDAITVTGM